MSKSVRATGPPQRAFSARQRKTATEFNAATVAWDAGYLRRAFELFLSAAERGDRSAQLNVGYFYDQGIGVRANKDQALVWYRRAHRQGDASASANIALIHRERGYDRRARTWLDRSLKAGNEDSRLHLAEIYNSLGRREEAVAHLRKLLTSRTATVESQRLARQRLRAAKASAKRA